MKVLYIILGALSLALFSCTSTRMYQSSQKGDLSNLITNDTSYHQPIKSDDKISLSVWGNDDLSFGSVFNIYNSNESFGKWILVDAEGYVVLPKLGRIKLKDLTCPQAADILTSKYKAFLVNPIVVVKVLNKEVSVLGEVTSPGRFVMDKEIVTISEIIAVAKGLDQFANPCKIQLIRNDTSYTINLAKFSSENLYRVILQADDIVYVPAKRIKKTAQNAPVLIPFASVLTSVAVLFSLLN